MIVLASKTFDDYALWLFQQGEVSPLKEWVESSRELVREWRRCGSVPVWIVREIHYSTLSRTMYLVATTEERMKSYAAQTLGALPYIKYPELNWYEEMTGWLSTTS